MQSETGSPKDTVKALHNPFQYERAVLFSPEQVLAYYIPDHSYSRFIDSTRNVFLVGERGTGKTMTLLYHSLPVKYAKAKLENQSVDNSLISVYVPCNTALTHRKDYELLEPLLASIISEHFLVVSIMLHVVDSLRDAPDLVSPDNENVLRHELEYILVAKLPDGGNLLDCIRNYVLRETSESQRILNKRNPEAFYDNARSFASGVVPLLTWLQNFPALRKTHFSLMIDDAHDLNEYQGKSLNSWIAYRDNSLFSFKVATARVNRPVLITATGGTLLEGHDYTDIDLERPYQNRYSEFGKLARSILKRRLVRSGIDQDPDAFFPISKNLSEDLAVGDQVARERAMKIYSESDKKSIGDYVYKFGRAEYFRSRSPKANLPPYSGVEILVHMGTGVIRNVLQPCYYMWERALSELRTGNGSGAIDHIPSHLQTEVILDRSQKAWRFLHSELTRTIPGCDHNQQRHIFQLFDQLAILFRSRLFEHKSEPRAVTFTISEQDFEHYESLMELLSIARKIQMLYTYVSSAKDSGRREVYYVPNRILWPERGLDPVGQHARVSIRARHLWQAAVENKPIPFDVNEAETESAIDETQGRLFDEA